MKYYCKKCGTTVDVDDNGPFGFKRLIPCPLVLSHGEMIEVPDCESLAQYKARTGKPYPDDGLVFYRHIFSDEDFSEWFIDTYKHTVEWCVDEGIDHIVIAHTPFFPPKEWRPE